MYFSRFYSQKIQDFAKCGHVVFKTKPANLTLLWNWSVNLFKVYHVYYYICIIQSFVLFELNAKSLYTVSSLNGFCFVLFWYDRYNNLMCSIKCCLKHCSFQYNSKWIWIVLQHRSNSWWGFLCTLFQNGWSLQRWTYLWKKTPMIRYCRKSWYVSLSTMYINLDKIRQLT